MSTRPADPRSRRAVERGRVYLRSSAVAVVLGLVAGCADLHWHKPGADAATLDADLQECTQRARLDARRQELPGLDSPLAIRADPQGRPVVVPNTTRDAERFLRERDFTAACMRGRGYALVPASAGVMSDR